MSTHTIDTVHPGTVDVPDAREHTAPAEPGDHEKLAHFVPADQLADAIIFGTPLTALCGKTWVPTRDPKQFPVCPDCKAAWEGARIDESNPGWDGI